MKNPLRNEKGIAMLVALSAILIMTFLAVEVGYNTQVELAVGITQMQRLKAYYLAKSGVQISLLRLKVYRTAIGKYGASLGKDASMLDMIWQLPSTWPPAIPTDAGLVSKADMQKSIKQSYIEGSFIATIESEGSRIDIADLASNSEALRKAATAQLTQLIRNRLDENDEWAQRNRDIRPEEIINNIADWMDEDSQGRNGGDENGIYSGSDVQPSNRPFKTMQELHYVKGVTDEIYDLLSKRITLTGIKAVNVNLASNEVLRSIDPAITKEIADDIIKRRNDPDLGQFTDNNSFLEFMKDKVNINNFNKDPAVPLYFESEFNFRIKSVGINGRAQREIFAIVYDFDKVKAQLAKALPTPTPTPSPSAANPSTPVPTPTPTPTPSVTPAVPTRGPPTVIYWQED